MAATRLLAFNWIVAAAVTAAVTVLSPMAARATESTDDPVSIREHAVAESTKATSGGPEGAVSVAERETAAGLRAAGDTAGPVADRGKFAGSQSEKVVQQFTGLASWYGPGFHGRRTANGEKFDQNELTAAHKTLPFNTRVRVTSVTSGKSVIVTINDRGPYVRGRMIDLSAAAAREIGLRARGVGKVKLEVLELPATTDHFAGSRSTDTREGPQAPRRVTSIEVAD